MILTEYLNYQRIPPDTSGSAIQGVVQLTVLLFSAQSHFFPWQV
jgi:hypothetical protein